MNGPELPTPLDPRLIAAEIERARPAPEVMLVDDEIQALARVLHVLRPLGLAARARVLSFAASWAAEDHP